MRGSNLFENFTPLNDHAYLKHYSISKQCILSLGSSLIIFSSFLFSRFLVIWPQQYAVSAYYTEINYKYDLINFITFAFKTHRPIMWNRLDFSF